MLEARSVAVVGASARPGSFGEQMMIQLMRGGFDGAVYPVNPRYQDVLGQRCLSSLADLPEPADLVLLGVSNIHLEDQLQAAANAGIRSAVIFATCYDRPEEGKPRLTERLASIARASGMALCGGNGMGFLNVERRLRACGFSEPEGLEPGPITFVSHSGSAFSAMLHNERGLRFNLAVSSGLELVTTTADYLEYALDQPSTKLIALFIETARNPRGFRAALARAADQDVPVIALKVGRTAPAKDLVTAHSGALAGEDGAYEALFEMHGVIRVQTLDEMADTLELFTAGRRAGPGGLAAIHDSGGERAQLIDAADQAGVPLARISGATEARLAAVLEEGLPPVNPLDAWGTGNDADRIFLECMCALLDDPDTGALAFCVDLTTEAVPEAGYSLVAREVFSRTSKPMALLANMASAVDRRDAGFVRAAGMPVLEGTATGLAAFGHLFDHRDFRERPPLTPAPGVDPEVRRRWQRRLRAREAFDEFQALSLLADYGIPVVRAEEAAGLDEALAAAGRVGWPVALKSAARGLRHKTEVGGVRLGLGGPDELRSAYEQLSVVLGPLVLVEAMAEPGVELALGVVRDAQFGPMVMAAAGGVLVEVLGDRHFAMPPLDVHRARGLLDRLAVRRLLEGVRGSPAADVGAVADALVRLSVLTVDLGEDLDALDVNPLMAGAHGCVAVDALLIARDR
ncbi:MAG: acetate--CoA ligase family protein [Actinobacteria bacterium]|nr:MAG: acetate--CoA ligase family protein [Actinomycetota bacterium]